MSVVNTMYKEMDWKRRIIKAGEFGRPKRKRKKSRYGYVGLVGFITGFLFSSFIFIFII